MGQIYNDVNIDEEEKRSKEINDNFHSVTNILEPCENIIHRNNEIDRIKGIMDKMNYRSVLLVGDKGIGKTSIIKGYVNEIKKSYEIKSIYTLDYDELCDRVSTPTEFSEIISSVIDITCSKDNGVILHINGLGHILNHRVYGNGGHSFLNKIINAIKNDDMRIIATVTSDEYNDIQDDFPIALDVFNIIHVNELTKEDTIDIIENLISDYEYAFGLHFPEKITKYVCENADKYIKDRPFPEKAIWLFDELCAKLRDKKEDTKKIVKTLDKLVQYEKELKDAYDNNDYLTCESLNKQIELLHQKIDKFNNTQREYTVDDTDVLEVIGDIVGVKMSGLDKNQTSFLQKMAPNIKESVIGQDETVDKIVKNIIRNKLGLRKSSHSMGNFIFIGSTGVGKTHLAKKIAEQLYGSEENLIRFDMSEYQSEIDVNKLLGSPPGYVGYKESGQLVKRLEKHPESVVLFDEIEKAHPKIYDVLLQLLDEGFITGSDGNKVDATKSLIIFTSNIGVRKAKEFGSSVGYMTPSTNNDKHKEDIIRKALNKRFSPEFLNRLDGICYFNNLDRNTLQLILTKEMNIMNENIENICGKKVELTKNVENWILDKVMEEENGARPIIRHLQQNIEEELSTMIVDDSDILKTNKKTLMAHVENDKIILK